MIRNRLLCSTLWMIGLHLALGDAANAQTAATTETTAVAAEKKDAAPVDPTGTWKWEYDFGDNTSEFKLKLKWYDKKLAGQYTAFDNTTEIEKVKLEKDQLSFVTTREFNENKFEVHFQGTVKPDEINGTIKLEFGNEPREFEWNAKRAVEIDDVLGVWELSVQTPNGVIEPKLTLTSEDDKLRGAYVSQFGEREPKNLTIKDNQLSWEISGDRDGTVFKVVYTGKPRANTIEGSAEFDFAGNTGTVEFTGKRTPPEKQEVRPAAEAKPAAEATPAATDAEAQ
jgi:hypothetical protein